MFSEKVNAVFEDQEFSKKLATLESKEEVIAAFAEKGMDYEKDFASVVNEASFSEGELDEKALENVSGGLTLGQVVQAWKFGWNLGVNIRRIYDGYKYGDPYRTYPKGQNW